MPRVTVLLPVRNAASTLEGAMQSILRQQWRDLQLLVLDDGSDDGSGSIAAALADSRVIVHRNEQPAGLATILNKGLALADSEYVARMDADDRSHPVRLTRQVACLQAHKDLAACGTAVIALQPDGGRRLWRYPTRHVAIRARMLFENALAHPSAMLRRGTIDRLGLGYDESFLSGEDYDFWERLGRRVKLANLPGAYLEYRVAPAASPSNELKRKFADQVRRRQLNALGITPTDVEWRLHSALCTWDGAAIGTRVQELEPWLLRLLTANLTAGQFDQRALRTEILTRFRRLCLQHAKAGGDGWLQWHGASELRSGKVRAWDFLALPLWQRRRLTAYVSGDDG